MESTQQDSGAAARHKRKMRQKFSVRTRSRKDFMINAPKLLAKQQKDGDSPIQNIIMGLKEKCR